MQPAFSSTHWRALGLALALATGGTAPAAAVTPPATPPAAGAPLSFVENRGQWAAPVRYRAALPGGTVFVTSTGLVYDWARADEGQLAHAALAPSAAGHAPAVRRSHAVFVDFVGANAAALVGEERRSEYHNYFLGADPRRWAARVPLFGAVRYAGLYPGTDLRCYGTRRGQLEYDFVLAPGARPAAVALRYRGAEALQLRPDGSLLVRTSVGDVREQRPVAYQPGPQGQRWPVACRYVLTGTTVRFAFPAGYNPRLPLVIDPVVDACTYSGSSSEIFGAATTFDAAGNIYSAGQAQSAGLPTSPGAVQAFYAGLGDVAIIKFSPNGRSRLYATYLGGNGTDQVLALRATAANELCVLTATNSFNFPVTPGCFQPSPDNLVVTKLNATGTALVGSTFLGGNDFETGAELIANASGEVYVTGTTSSFNFPTTAGALSRTLRGQDAFVTCLNNRLTGLVWSTFLGGSGPESPLDVALAPNNELVVAGRTSSVDFPVTAGALQTVFPGGGSVPSSFVSRLRADGTGLQASTFFGPASISKIALQATGAPVVAGSSAGAFPLPTAGALNAGTGAFVTGLASDLRTIRYSARLNPLVLSAFGTDDCGHLFLAGFGGLPLPPLNPLPTPRPQSGFFAVTLDVGAARPLFSSAFGFVGGHAHTPSHRYDRNGRLYQNVCENSGTYPVTPGAVAPTKGVGGYDMLTFVINQATTGGSSLQVGIGAPDSACAPFRVAFANTSVGAQRYRWTFGDGTAPDTARSPQHTFTAPGVYRVRLLASRDASGPCSFVAVTDSAAVTVRVLAPPATVLPPVLALCPGTSVVLTAAGGPGYSYQWTTSGSSLTATTRTLVVQAPGTYRVRISNGRCSTRDSTVARAVVPPRLVADTSTCGNAGLELRVRADVGSTFRWSTGATTSQIVAPASGTYGVEVRTNGCTFQRQARVTLNRPPLRPNVITPNRDGQNDTFVPAPLVAGTRLRIFNRWGRLIFSHDNYQNDWGADQAPGIYFYVVENEQFCERRVKGWVELIR